MPSLSDFYNYSRTLKNAKLLNEDFQIILFNEARKGDFVYLDPPYAVKNRRIFRQYGPQTFGLEDIERLQNTLKILDKRRVKFVLSYALCKEAKSIFAGWNVRQVHTQRNISGFAKHRRRAIELIISNFTF
ncbi:DNA adenine methylase [Candidatus Brocadia sinica]|uniref:DNA adenine methylase n=1 Tax=Candidatus Brocadia TaxID=380240 RepID=UPI003B9681A2